MRDWQNWQHAAGRAQALFMHASGPLRRPSSGAAKPRDVARRKPFRLATKQPASSPVVRRLLLLSCFGCSGAAGDGARVGAVDDDNEHARDIRDGNNRVAVRSSAAQVMKPAASRSWSLTGAAQGCR